MRIMLERFRASLLVLVFVACTSTRPPQERAEHLEGDPAPGQMVMVVGDLPNLVFAGSVRRDAKLTMVASTTINYASIIAVTSLTAPSVNNTSPRTGVETNYAAFTAYLYAYNLPTDNDFHLIIGDTPRFEPGRTNLINVEVSGRPSSTDTVFRAVRTAFLNKVGNPSTMSQSTYTCLPTPVQITVSGGPFWDTQHPHGGSGTRTCNGQEMYTRNGWELHPVTSVR